MLKAYELLGFEKVNDVDETKARAIAESIKKNGWKGAPILTYGNCLVTGSHRLRAFEILEEEAAEKAEAEGDVAVGDGAWTAVHHAFTSPKPEFMDTFDTNPGDALAYAYDIVANGNEIGGGSIRIHNQEVQKRVFNIMGISNEDAQEKFGFLLDAFQYGAPPHGGIAFGWDRIVALLAGTDSIREVIAFPKTGNGHDPLTDAPAPITDEQRAETGVDHVPEEDDEEDVSQKVSLS